MKKSLFILMTLLCLAACKQEKEKKAVYIIIDGVPADMIERLDLPAIKEISGVGAYGRSYVGGTVGRYDQTPTISAVGYTDLLTSTWVNKHNVPGNSNLEPNYNYWTLFRIAKEQKKDFKTGIFSSWIDNRTVLIGEGKPETGNLQIDYVCDGYELDTVAFPHKEYDLHILDIDEHVSKEAAKCIKENAPDLSWVYLWYTDDAGHTFGNGETFDEAVRRADKQIERVWEAVKYREKTFDEDWMIVVTTDHGRDFMGYGHGKQSERERITWVATNQKVNERMKSGKSAITDIAPSICRFMGFEVPRDILWEQDGMPFIGKVDIMEMDILPYDNYVDLKWECINPKAAVNVWAAASNNFKEGGKDEWINVGSTSAGKESFRVDLKTLPESKFYKFVLETPNNHLNRWYSVTKEKYTNFKLPVAASFRQGWADDVRTGLDDFIATYGSSGSKPAENPYVVFDFDNTTSIFDIQYQMVPFQPMMMAFEIEPQDMRSLLMEDLTKPEAYSELIEDICWDYRSLWNKFGPFSASGMAPSDTAALHKDPEWLDFATKMYNMYNLVYEVEPNEVCISWLTSWFHGMTNEEIYALSKASHETFKDVETSTVTWGGDRPCSWTSGISVTEEVRDLWKSLKNNGIDIWVCSGSQLEQVRAAVDVFGLHEYCTGILAVPTKYDPSTAGYLALPGGRWQRDTVEMNSFTWSYGKVKAINNALVTRYGHGPDAGFMDSGGDFHFCTEYSSLKLVICFNTANKDERDGAGLVAETALFERDVLGYNLKKANKAGDTFYVLQGRNENGLRTLIPSNATIKYGTSEERLFKSEANITFLDSLKKAKPSVKEIFNTYALGSIEGFTGYHSR